VGHRAFAVQPRVGVTVTLDLDEAVREFLIESRENLDQLDKDFVALEAEPGRKDLVSSIFRTIHTIKGTAGFLGFRKLEGLTHVGESLLSRIRDGELAFIVAITSELLTMVDRIRSMLSLVETTGNDGDHPHEDVIARLNVIGELNPSRSDSAGRDPAWPGREGAEPTAVA
jgi:two-component system chemotaxis sensor kinase CheA